MEFIAAFAQALEQSPFGAWARGSSHAYPYANVAHLLGLVMLIGGIGLLDLRIAGLFQSLPLPALSRILTRFGYAGLALLVPSGLILFAADAGPLIKSPTFLWKISLVGIALVNAAAFRLLWQRRIDGLGSDMPMAARVMAAGSVTVWLWIAALGRLVAYA